MRISDWSSDVCSSDLIRAILLGGLLTLAFTAANVYLGLKVGLTFATSIPAAVISMALLRYMAGSTILENNIVQTIASAAGTLAAIIFVLPGLVMVGYWQGFPLLETTAITMLGGILGVLFRSEEHTSELQSLMRISYAVFCLKKKKKTYRESYTNVQQ